jgi:hypothetical protein
MKASSTWAGTWSTKVGQSGAAWASGYIAAGDAVFKAGAAAGPQWQAGVNTPQALAKFQKNLGAVTMASVTPVVNGAGMTKYTSSATTKNANYAAFASLAGPIFTQGLAQLPAKGPRGSGANQARMTAWSQYLIGKVGQF